MGAIHTATMDNCDLKSIVQTADGFNDDQKRKIASCRSLALLDELVPPMIQYRDQTTEKDQGDDAASKALKIEDKDDKGTGGYIKPAPGKIIRQLNRMVLFHQKTLEDADDIDAYLDRVKKTLVTMMQGCDGIKLN